MNLTAFTTWKVQTVAPAQSIAENPNEVQVTLTSGSTVVLKNPRIAMDTLVIGVRDGEYIALPLSSIDHLALKKTNPLATIVGVTLLALTLFFFSEVV